MTERYRHRKTVAVGAGADMGYDRPILREAMMSRWLLIVLALLCVDAPRVWAQAPAASETAAPRAQVTRHRLTAGGESFDYTARVAMIGLGEGGGVIKANIWSTSYLRDGVQQGKRPVTFVFNGGPGASSAYLHMGGIGPRRLVTPDDGSIPAVPPSVADNAESWLSFTDLVFFDPVGTGWSVPAQVEGKPVATSEFWGVTQDVAWTARFIRQWLNQNNRWSSPIFIAGESYGGFRAARLAAFLPQQFAVPLAGVIMISPFLEGALSRGDDRLHPLNAALRLPSFAATAWHHDRLPGVGRSAAARDAFLGEVENFALTAYLSTLALGHAADPLRQEAIALRVAEITGLPPATVRRHGSRISREIFVKEGLPGRVLGRYDSAVTLPDTDPGAAQAEDPDPSTAPFGAALGAAINIQLRETLKLDRAASYVLLNGEANRRWDWQPGNGSVAQLRAGMIANPGLRVLIVHGRFDLVTPYFVSSFVAQQLNLPAELRANLTLALTDGGHMMYFHASERWRLTELAAGFYAQAGSAGR